MIPIVEGHGEVQALPILLRRIWLELLRGEFLDVLTPIRCKRDKLIDPLNDELSKAIHLAVGKAQNIHREPMGNLILVLFDAEDDLACELGPAVLKRANECRPDVDVASVVVNHCYETWFAASAESLVDHLDLTGDLTLPSDPENDDMRKAWVAKRIRRAKYSETVDQARLTAAMDLTQCRAKSRSFDKLCRELEARLHTRPINEDPSASD